MLAQIVKDKSKTQVVSLFIPSMGTTATRARKTAGMNPPEFYYSKVKEDPKEFIDEVCEIHAIMGVTLVEKPNLATYPLKWVSYIWFIQWKEAR